MKHILSIFLITLLCSNTLINNKSKTEFRNYLLENDTNITQNNWLFYLERLDHEEVKKIENNAAIVKSTINGYKNHLHYDSTILIEHLNDCKAYQYFEKDSLNETISWSCNFDKSGNIIEEAYIGHKYSSNQGAANSRIIYTYDNSNKLISSIRYPQRNRYGLAIKTFYSYTSDSLLTKVTEFKCRYLTAYDIPHKNFNTKAGKTIIWKLKKMSLLHYNKKGQLIAKDIICDNNGFSYDRKYKYVDDTIVNVYKYTKGKREKTNTYVLSTNHDYRYSLKHQSGSLKDDWSILYEKLVPEIKLNRIMANLNKYDKSESIEIKYDSIGRLQMTKLTNSQGITTHKYVYE